jgi:hypothetical protein
MKFRVRPTDIPSVTALRGSAAHRHHFALPLALAAALLLSACGDGGSSPGASVPGGSATISPSSVAVTIRIDAPTTTGQATRRRPKYLSPATQSITISVNGASPVAQNLTPSGGDCSTPSFGATPVCTLVAMAPLGNDTFTFVTYDGTGGTGNALSQNTVAQTIVSGQTNTVSITLEGVPTGVVAYPYPGQTNVTATASGYTLLGTTPANFLVVATDADGNVIVGPGAPALSVTSSSANMTVATVANNPNKFVLTPVTSGISVTLNLSASGGNGGHATGSVGLALKALPPTSLPKILYAYINSPEIDAFAAGSVGTSAPAARFTSSSLGVPGFLAWGPNGALYASGNVDTGHLVVAYTAAQLAAGSGSPTTIIDSYQASLNKSLPTQVGGLGVDTSGDVFILGQLLAQSGTNALEVFEYKAGFSPTTVPITIPSSPTGETAPTLLYVDSSNRLYVVNTPTGTPATILVFSTVTPNSAPMRTIGGPGSNAGFTTVAGMAVGADGTLTVVDGITNNVYQFAPGSTSNPSPATVFQSPSQFFAAPVTVDANNNVYGNQLLNPGNQVDVYPAGATGVPTALFTLQVTPLTVSSESFYFLLAP